MRNLIASLIVVADAGFASGLAGFLAKADIPHTPRELGEALGALVFWVVMQLWHRYQMREVAGKEYDRRAALPSPPADAQFLSQADELGK